MLLCKHVFRFVVYEIPEKLTSFPALIHLYQFDSAFCIKTISVRLDSD